jgi:hypothetical protein
VTVDNWRYRGATLLQILKGGIERDDSGPADADDRQDRDASDDDVIRMGNLVRSSAVVSEPDRLFRESLRLRLIAAADQRPPLEATGLLRWRQSGFLIGAAGIVSAAAVLAVVAHARRGARSAA